MRAIQKFPLEIPRNLVTTQVTTLSVPGLESVLMGGKDTAGVHCVWCLLDPKGPPTTVNILLIKGEAPVDEQIKVNHLASYPAAAHMWHTFQILND